MPENPGLPRCVARAMASHSRKDKGRMSRRGKVIDHPAHNECKIGNPAAAHTDGDSRTRGQFPRQAARCEFLSKRPSDIGKRAMREILPDGNEHESSIVLRRRGPENRVIDSPQ